jgi:glycine dehydrogenase subunit 1
MRHLDGKAVEAPLAGGLTDGAALAKALNDRVAAVIVQYPNFLGGIEEIAAVAGAAQGAGALFVVVANPVALGLLTRPGGLGADIVCGEGQPLGCYIWYGGPGFGFFAVKQELLRRIPGRIVGQTKDLDGKRAFVLTLQTREQHIRREKATSNICTNQALMALRATIFMSTLGPSGLRNMADLSLQKAHYLADRIGALKGWSLPVKAPFFHEFVARSPVAPSELNKRLLAKGHIGGYDLGRTYPEFAGHVLFCATEKRTKADIDGFVQVLEEVSR